MPIELFETKEAAKDDLKEVLKLFDLNRRVKGYWFPVIVKVKFDERDKSRFATKESKKFNFSGMNGEKYYIVLNAFNEEDALIRIKELNSEFNSEFYNIVY